MESIGATQMEEEETKSDAIEGKCNGDTDKKTTESKQSLNDASMKRKLSIDEPEIAKRPKQENEKENVPDVVLVTEDENRNSVDVLLNKKRKLQEQLRNHEATLVLLKKIRSSQVTPQLTQNNDRKTSSSSSTPHATPTVVNKEIKQSRIPTPVHRTQKTAATDQNRAAAKLALRKELEKTLLQIPPPKPPPPEMNFLPSLCSTDFGMLLGLEEVVKAIRESANEKSDVKYVFNPFTCIQCNTDYTPVWKRDKPGSKAVICEQCVTNNQKKALKQEHTNRLKNAFVKALQREQEIEQKLAQGIVKDTPLATTAAHTSSTNSQSKTSSSSFSSEKSSQAVREKPHLNVPPISSVSTHSAVQAQVQAAFNFQTMQQQAVAALANYKLTPEQIRQQQQLLLQTQQAQLRLLQQHQTMIQNSRSLAMGSYSPQQLAKMADLQRQFFMDLMPGLTSAAPRQSNLWKS